MNLFISYARVDKPYCKQIIDLLDMHDVWYDQRLHIGQKWWDEIVRRLHWCDGFIYLLSHDSGVSEYCGRELEIALNLNKRIFPVLIQPGATLPRVLSHIQYADLSGGLDVKATKTLLSAIFLAERQLNAMPTPILPPTPITGSQQPKVDGAAMIEEAVRAFERCDYDRAVFLIKQVQDSGYRPRFINLEAMLKQAEEGLARQAYLREAQREYAPIARMMQNEVTRAMGCTAFRSFKVMFPDYDPENLEEIYQQTIQERPPFDVIKAMPLLEWCRVPEGKVTIDRNRSKKVFTVNEFYMSKYPVTNAQFQVFIDAEDGYRNPAWWQSSPEVKKWHNEHEKPIPSPANRENHPRAFVCWHEASAFCQWLSFKTGYSIKLPTEQQWQRAALGDNNWAYPWGAKFDKGQCNCKESETRGTTAVTQYPKGASAYGVCDMLGNVWEWCSNGHASGDITDVTVDILRVVRGGSFMSPKKRTNIAFFYYLNPLYRYQSIGFRIACEADAKFPGV